MLYNIYPTNSKNPTHPNSDSYSKCSTVALPSCYLCAVITRFALFAIFFFSSLQLIAQNELRVLVRDAESKEPLPGASVVVTGTSIGMSTDEDGIAVLDLPDGNVELQVSFLGYRSQKKRLAIPTTIPQPLEFLLHSEHEELEEVVISSTRSTRTIADIPTRVEFIAGEELDEKSNMKPGDIRMLLNESTGIQTQQTSATSANSSIRIQGLDGRYT